MSWTRGAGMHGHAERFSGKLAGIDGVAMAPEDNLLLGE